jgi:allophanate hydrolase
MSATERARAAIRRNVEADRPEIWIHLRSPEEVLADAAAIDRRVSAGEDLPLAGVTFAVKDNIDVGGLPTTAACPSIARVAGRSATCVTRLVAAGAILIGKTNLDQFATGLVGTRSPYGAVRDAARPEYVSGGSSSGSAVAVALGIVDIALGTDTAGSGRVPASLQGIVGLKPTRGLIPTTGVIPACRSFDCVSIFATSVARAEQVMRVVEGTDASDPLSRVSPGAQRARTSQFTIAVPSSDQLHRLTSQALEAFEQVVRKLVDGGATVVDVDLAPFLEAGELLYGGGFVAERYAAVGMLAASARDVDPVVARILDRGRRTSARDLVRDQQRLDELRAQVQRTFVADALLLPTTTRQPTIAAVAADPDAVNDALGCYSRFANMLDLCAIAVPAGVADEGHFGISVFATAFGDRVVADIARLLLDDLPVETDDGQHDRIDDEAVSVLVVGAHLLGQPLNREIVQRGGLLLGKVATASRYRLHLLDTEPRKPGLVRCEAEGASIDGELWSLPAAGLGSLLATLPSPMTLGQVTLSDGNEVVGFLAEPWALTAASDITSYGSWEAFLAAEASAPA